MPINLETHLIPYNEVPAQSFLFAGHNHNFLDSIDAFITWKDLVQTASQLGWHAVARTNHDSAAKMKKASKAAHKKGLLMIEGIEITTMYMSNRRSLKIPHVLVYSADQIEKSITLPLYMKHPHAILEWVSDHPELFFAFAHPIPDNDESNDHWRSRLAATEIASSFTWNEIVSLIHQFPQLVTNRQVGIEVINKRYRPYHDKTLELADDKGLIPVGGPDTHKAEHLVAGGGMWFEEHPKDEAELLTLIRQGKGNTFYKQADLNFRT